MINFKNQHVEMFKFIKHKVISYYESVNTVEMAQQMKHLKSTLETTDDGNEDNIQQDLCEELNGQIRLLNANRIDGQLLATVPEKCPNIQTIDFREISNRYETYIPEVLTTFRDNCRHLRDIYCNLKGNSEQFYRTFGRLIAGNGCQQQIIGNQSLIHCHRLSQLSVYSLSDVFVGTSDQLLAENLRKKFFYFNSSDNNILKARMDDINIQALIHCHRLSLLWLKFLRHVFDGYYEPLMVRNLREFSFEYHSTQDYHRLSAFVTQNQSLKCLTICVDMPETHKTMTEMCGELSRLTQLQDLRLMLTLMSDQNLLNEMLRTIGLNCKQLQRLQIWLICPDFSFNNNLMDCLSCYPKLKRLEYFTPFKQLVMPLRFCHKLTHLSLNIQQYLPRLQHLSIVCDYLSAESLSHISRLSALQTLEIKTGYSIRMETQIEALITSSETNTQSFYTTSYIEYNIMKHKRTSLESRDDGNDDNRQQIQIYAKNSMDRFGDDLYGLILSHLSLGDRFRCECVSKQFQRTNQSLRCLIVHNISHLNEMCGQLSRLTQLRELSLGFDFMSDGNSVHNFLRTIGVNCKQLKRLSLVLNSRSKDMNDKSLDSLRFYSRLKRLHLKLFAAIDQNSLEALKLCHRLTHFTLDLNEIKDNLTLKFDEQWPLLQYLCIHRENHTIDINYLDYLSRLTALQTLVIHCRYYNNYNNIDIENLFPERPKLKLIEIHYLCTTTKRLVKFFWNAVRQRVGHQRVFIGGQQLILGHNGIAATLNETCEFTVGAHQLLTPMQAGGHPLGHCSALVVIVQTVPIGAQSPQPLPELPIVSVQPVVHALKQPELIHKAFVWTYDWSTVANQLQGVLPFAHQIRDHDCGAPGDARPAVHEYGVSQLSAAVDYIICVVKMSQQILTCVVFGVDVMVTDSGDAFVDVYGFVHYGQHVSDFPGEQFADVGRHQTVPQM
ncbi:unnamed protein product, partial [Medioppia subpectinata]